MATVVKACKCEHTFQDKEYGKGMRVFNETASPNGSRCTVCGAGDKKSEK